ncbi:DUF402 domain-containing protein [Marinitoga litoralis]|jgi:predicted RNA-binding protein associated with RNAse of E/G family|uniref:DUF402 domain-containing protein n=1 Tax=Marinitoga litoralis TaxID=570855 RepID=UPI00195F89D2|nr:DUF402 domain-containing protein [Marinitoga litoralis]MBM7560365.1 putative RNA-binding protein associated with RNAse of E/G family [Marinitoga litoralis]
MKHYKFDLINKKEHLISPTREVNVYIESIFNFNNSVGLERNWIVLDNHNSIKKIKRLILPNSYLMLTSFLTDKNSHLEDYLIYIDFGKYIKNNDIIEFIDLELDIIIKKDNSFEIDDIDELIEKYEDQIIEKKDFYSIIKEETFLINQFQKIGIFNTLENIFDKTSIKWLLNLG